MRDDETEEIGTIINDTVVFNAGGFKIVKREIKLRHGEKITHYFWDRTNLEFVVVCALTKDQKIILTKEPKYAIWERTVGLASGSVEKGETPKEAALRELLEETGYRSSDMRLMGKQMFDFVNKIKYGGHWLYLALNAEFTQKPEILNDAVLVDLKDLDLLLEGSHPEVEIKIAIGIACLARAQKYLSKLKSQPA